jgi:uncharacterized protein YbbC (DUF1343 family)/CubicO group peptidase (beta-lactamase class C family)
MRAARSAGWLGSRRSDVLKDGCDIAAPLYQCYTRDVLAARVVYVAFLVLLALAPSAAAEPPDLADVDEAANDAVASGEIPGVVVLVGRGDEILLHRAYGSRRLVPDARPMTPDTIFDIASLTKPVGTTLAVLSLVERGAIKLDAPLGRYLKEFHAGAFKEATIRRILTHSAGFPPYPANGIATAGFPAAAQSLAQLPLDYPPGTAFQYSDTGFILLGEVVRRVSGEPLDRYLARVFFQPLGLRDTTFRPRDAVKDRIAPTEFANGHMLQGEVHDPRARLLGGVAGNAGMFSTAADLARICRMLLHGGTLDGRRYLTPATVELMWEPSADGRGTRTLGWDLSSPYSSTMAPFFPMGSVGHVGFTGTALWVDPASRVYVILLSNRVHPSGGGAARIRELRVRVAAAVGAALFSPPPAPAPTAAGSTAADAPAAEPAPPPPAIAGRVRTGLDVVEGRRFAAFAGQSVGLVTNQTGLDAEGRRAVDLFARAPGVRLQAIFSPEHGITGEANADVPDSRDAATARPIWSLYGPTRRPSPEALKGVSVLVVDIQDVGVRYYTYLTTLVYVMEEAARHRIPVVVLDRPDPITGRVVEGPLVDPDLLSFTAPHTIPVRTGLTIGEFARMAAAERKIPVALTVVPLEGWERSRWYDETGLPWVNPSPNIRSVTQALLYSGVGLLEGTNLSVGRGTNTPFEVVGAPWIEPHGLADALTRLRLPGVGFEPLWFTPTVDHYAQVQCGGVRLVVTDREAIRPVTVALAVARELRARHRNQWRPESIQNLLVNRSTMWALLSGEILDRLATWADIDRSSFLNRRASYLMYR